jgi:uncharacterized protein YndB with AHSA1/START domain/DNA-binding transcriptional ArsR family regulator
VDAHLLAALAEPNRLRIVELLDAAPRAVGEIAGALELRQPQVTKHLQTLERAGLVEMHPLGQRRIYALRRQPLRELRGWLGRFDTAHPSEDVLVDYRAALEAERARGPQTDRELRIERTLAAPPPEVWRAWTSADSVRRWWAPRHFTVADCDVEPVPGGRLSIVMAEGDGTRHRAEGRFLELTPPSELRFELAPLGPDGAPLFSATHELRLEPRRGRTRLTMTIRVSGESAAAGPALAGMRIGWGQSLDKLEAALGGD